MSTSQPKVVVEDTRQGLKNWPCQRCHDKITLDPQASPISNQHMEINIQHFAGAERCITCHDHQRVERLRLLTQETVPMTQSSLACGQCHAEKKRDWDIGAHGKHVGSWSGTRYRATCPDCHNPHAPRRSSVVALPAPPRPKLGIPKDHSHD